ncbi:hypothetical protein Tco_1047222, partial [Tanacetum coccineum]
MADPNSPMPVARRAVNELIEFRELFDSLMCLRDDKRVEDDCYGRGGYCYQRSP